MQVVATYTTPLKSNATWYSDSNGRDSQPRIRDFRFSDNYSVNEPVSARLVQTA